MISTLFLVQYKSCVEYKAIRSIRNVYTSQRKSNKRIVIFPESFRTMRIIYTQIEDSLDLKKISFYLSSIVANKWIHNLKTNKKIVHSCGHGTLLSIFAEVLVFCFSWSYVFMNEDENGERWLLTVKLTQAERTNRIENVTATTADVPPFLPLTLLSIGRWQSSYSLE